VSAAECEAVQGEIVLRITQAIIRQEAEPITALNPGNLRDCPWCVFADLHEGGPLRGSLMAPLHRVYSDGTPVQYETRKGSGRFWIPRSRAEGIFGIIHVVSLHVVEGDNLRKLITRWAPPADHNATAEYVAHVAEWAAVPDPEAPLMNFLDA
jgi:hypothetical protein